MNTPMIYNVAATATSWGTYGITVTRTKVDDMPAPIASHIRIVSRTRKPETRAFSIDIPVSSWIDTSDVPSQYKPLVDASLMELAEDALNGFVTSKATAGNLQIPAFFFTLTTLLEASASKRMTAALLIGMWRNSVKYVFDVAPKLSSLGGSPLLRYQANIERHERRLAALCGRNAEMALSADDLDKLLVNLSDADNDTPFGEYLATRTEEVRVKLVEDSDAL